MGFPHGRVGRNLPDGEAYAYCGVIVEGSGLGEPVRKVPNPVISPLSEHRRGLIMLCNSDFSERLGGWESVIWVLSVEGHALDTEPSTISRFSVESHRSEYRTIHDFTVQRGKSPLWIPNHPRFNGSAWKVPDLEAVTKRAERANGGTRAACFEQPEGVHSGCGDAKPAMFTSCYSIYIHPRYEA